MSTSAFPSPGVVLVANSQQQGAYEGMTLRDYFAAKAMQGLVTRGQWIAGMDQPRKEEQWTSEAYRIAAAMLKARDA